MNKYSVKAKVGLTAPARAMSIGWWYRGSWYLTKRSAAFPYWKDLIFDLANRRHEETAETGRIQQKPPPAFPTFEQTLASL